MKRFSQILLLISILLISAGSCNKENVVHVNDLPDYTYRLKKFQQIDFNETTTTTSRFTYENGKLITIEQTIDPGLIAISHFTYSNDKIVRTDTNYYNGSSDSVGYQLIEYTVQNNKIVEAKVEGYDPLTVNYYYTGGYRTLFELYENGEVLPLKRGQYTWAGDQLTTYAYYRLNDDNELVLGEINEYFYKNGNLDEVLYSSSSSFATPPELQRKLKYTYHENLAKTVDWYSYTNEGIWVHYFQTRLTYDSEGNLSEASEYSIDDGAKELIHQYYMEYEVGKGNLEYLSTTNTQSPGSLGVIATREMN